MPPHTNIILGLRDDPKVFIEIYMPPHTNIIIYRNYDLLTNSKYIEKCGVKLENNAEIGNENKNRMLFS